MELHYPSILLACTFLLLLRGLVKGLIRPSRSGMLPPRPWRLPIVGNIHHLIGAVPHRALRDLSRRLGPLMHLKLGQVDLMVVSSARVAREILKTHDLNFASRPSITASTIMGYGNTDVAFAPYGSYWRQLRKICIVELLSARRVKVSSAIREAAISNLVRRISSLADAKSAVNLTEELLALSNAVTARAAFGAECRHGQGFITASRRAIELASGFSLPDLFPSSTLVDTITRVSARVRRCHREVDAILDEIIQEHQAKRASKGIRQSSHKAEEEGEEEDEEEEEQKDLVDVLLGLKEDGNLDLPLTLDNIKAVILDMFVGGTETSSSIIVWAMAELMRHPEIMEKAQEEVRRVFKGKASSKMEECDIQELHLMKLIIKETLRLHPPLPLLLPRACGATCEIDGYEIPAGSRVIINAWAIARDPTYWECPENFMPERFRGSSVDYKGNNFEYIPFGGGRRICPGMAFGVANVEPVLASLLLFFDWKLPDGMKPQGLDMAESAGATAGRKEDLCLLPTNRIKNAYFLMH